MPCHKSAPTASQSAQPHQQPCPSPQMPRHHPRQPLATYFAGREWCYSGPRGFGYWQPTLSPLPHGRRHHPHRSNTTLTSIDRSHITLSFHNSTVQRLSNLSDSMGAPRFSPQNVQTSTRERLAGARTITEFKMLKVRSILPAFVGTS